MKKGKLIFTFYLIVMLLSACNPTPPVEKVKVTFIGLDGGEISKVEVDKGTIVTPPDLESTEEYTFYGWSLNKDGKDLFDFSTPIASDTTLYSVWLKNYLIYQDNIDGTLTVIGLSDPYISVCSIPETCNGKTITTIADAVFPPYTREITIPKTVTSISDAAFVYCYYLGSIEVSKENTYFKIIDGALYTMDESKLIYFPVNNFKMVGDTPQAIVEYTIPNSVTEIGGYAFSNNKNLTSITIPDSVTTIGEGAFYSCGSLTSITIPQSVKSIGEGAFNGCSSLNSINVEPDNRFYKSKDGVLFNIEGTKLIQYPKSKEGNEYIIPDGVKTIGQFSFYGSRNLTKISIPNSVTAIDYKAFGFCLELPEIEIPNSVKSIGGYAFHYCEKLKSIVIPSSVTSIGERAFFQCDKLLEIKINKPEGTLDGAPWNAENATVTWQNET